MLQSQTEPNALERVRAESHQPCELLLVLTRVLYPYDTEADESLILAHVYRLLPAEMFGSMNGLTMGLALSPFKSTWVGSLQFVGGKLGYLFPTTQYVSQIIQ